MIIAGAMAATLVGLLVGVEVSKHDRPAAVTTTLTFLKRVPVTSVVHDGTTRTETQAVTQQSTVTSVDGGTNTTVVRTTTVTTPPITSTKTQTVTETVTETTTTTVGTP